MTKPIRQIRVEGNIAYVPLTKGYEAIIDAVDVALVCGWNWRANVNRNTVYAVRSQEFPGGKQRTIYLHRIIAETPDGMAADHINRDGLDNRRANLRNATKAQNVQNQSVRNDNKSGVKGVHWNKARGKWRAMIGAGGNLHSLGNFSSIEEAAAAYAAASAQYHGKFGRVA